MIIPGNVDDRMPLEYKDFVEFIYDRLVADWGYIGRNPVSNYAGCSQIFCLK